MQKLNDGTHIGHVLLDSMRSNPNEICQIDAATGEEETNGSVLSRSIRLARAMRNFGLQPGDVLAVGGNNHIDLHIPFYAGLFNGYPVVGVDPMFKYDEIKSSLNVSRPSVAFCALSSHTDYERAAKDLGIKTKVLSFEDGEESMRSFMDKYDVEEPESEFKVADIDIEKNYVFLASTSGTSGVPKVAAFRHDMVMKKILLIGNLAGNVGHRPRRSIGLICSPVQWISGILGAVYMPIMNQTKLQTSKPNDVGYLVDAINKYKPDSVLVSPSVMTALFKRKDDVNLSCFTSIIVTGAKVNYDMLSELQTHLRNSTAVMEAYGLTETLGPILVPNMSGVKGSCGTASNLYEMKIVDPDTGLEITEPKVPGELYAKGLCFTEYLNNPEETKKAFTEDGFFKTGDLLYRDERYNYFFVDRLKMLIKYRNSHIVPSELEDVILQHRGVEDVCVTAVDHPEDSQHPVACVVRKPDSTVTAQEIKDLVSSKLSKNKQLRGGVVFCDALPMTSTGKIARGKLKELVLNAVRE